MSAGFIATVIINAASVNAIYNALLRAT